MTIPYYPQLENYNRTLNMKLRNDSTGRDNIVVLKLLASYITPLGHIADVTTGHKENNFIYAVNRGWDLLDGTRYNTNSLEYMPAHKLIIVNEKGFRDEISTLSRFGSLWKTVGMSHDNYFNDQYVDIDTSYEYKSICVPISVFRDIQRQTKKLTPEDKYKRILNELHIKLSELEKHNTVSSYDIMHYYNLWGALRTIPSFNGKNFAFCRDYSEEIRQNLIGIISGQLAIHNTFLELKTYIDDSKIYEFIKKSLYWQNDLLVSLVGFDKVETQLKRTITTSKLNINEAFFNYLIMNWHVYNIPKFVVDKDNKCIKIQECTLQNDTFLEREYADEIALIRKKVPLKERTKYFR